MSDPAVAAPAAPAPAPAPAPAAAPDPKAAAPAPAPDPKAAAPAPAAAPVEQAKGYWPEDWQKRFAGDDEKELKQVSRYQSPEEIWKKARSLERRLSSGELKPALPKDAKPEEVNAWRKDMGIPEKPDGYDLKGIEIPEADKELVSSVVSRLHGKNASPEIVRETVAAYYEIAKHNEQARKERDETERLEAIDTLAGEWGGKFSGYKSRVENYLNMFPESVRDAVKSARLPDGRAMFNHPDILRTIVALSLKDIPDGVMVPSGGGDMQKTMVDQYQEIQKAKTTDRKAFNKDTAMQERERDLIDAMMKHGFMDKDGRIVQRKAA